MVPPTLQNCYCSPKFSFSLPSQPLVHHITPKCVKMCPGSLNSIQCQQMFAVMEPKPWYPTPALVDITVQKDADIIPYSVKLGTKPQISKNTPKIAVEPPRTRTTY